MILIRDGDRVKYINQFLIGVLIIITIHFVYFSYFHNKINKIETYENFYSVTYTDLNHQTNIKVNLSLLEDYINDIYIKPIKKTHISSYKYLTICRSEDCDKKDILYFDHHIMIMNKKYYKIYNVHELEKVLESYNINYCSPTFDEFEYEEFELYYNTNILSIKIKYLDTIYTLEIEDAYELVSLLGRIPHDRLFNEINELLNYEITITFINNHKIIYNDKGEIYIQREGENCFKYYIRSETQKNKIKNLIEDLILS